MLYYWLYPLRDFFYGFNVFRYITFRAAGAAVTAFLISILLAPWIIRQLDRLKIGETIRRRHVPTLYPLHANKEGTPTMGGILIVTAIVISTLLWADVFNKYILLVLASIIWLGIVGFIDDYIKLTSERSRGLRAITKLTGQTILGLLVGIYLLYGLGAKGIIEIPFLKNLLINLGYFYIFYVALVIIASSNAVNITDGLDGLAIGCVVMAALAYSIMSYIAGNVNFSDYLMVFYVPGSGELAIFCAAIAGAGLGFLWFNSYPASIFMGDTGALALGGAIGAVAILIKKELLLVVVGGVFVIEALSVILQVASVKIHGKRIFKMAPLHHHFQLNGWPESKIIIRFWIIAGIFAILSLATLKLR